MSGAVRDEDFIAGVMTRRCLAWLIDVVLICAIMSLLWVFLFVFGLLTLGLGFGAMAVLPAVPFLYHFLSLLRYGSATPGQAMLGLTVRRDADLGPPTTMQALIFTVVFYLTMATSGLLLLIAPFTVRHRTLHDLASDLVVVRRHSFATWCRQTGSYLGWSRLGMTSSQIPGASQNQSPQIQVDREPASLEHGDRNVRMNFTAPRRPQFFYTTAPLPCPYVAGRTERKVVTEITGPAPRRCTTGCRGRVSAAATTSPTRRSARPASPASRSAFRSPPSSPAPRCAGSPKPTPARKAFVVAPRATAEQFQLFQRYQRARHSGGDMATMSFYDYRAMVEDTPVETFVAEFRDPDTRLISACLADRLGDGLSAVYSFYAPTHGKAVARHARDPLADRSGARTGPALRVSRLLGAREPEDGL